MADTVLTEKTERTHSAKTRYGRLPVKDVHFTDAKIFQNTSVYRSKAKNESSRGYPHGRLVKGVARQTPQGTKTYVKLRFLGRCGKRMGGDVWTADFCF
jgi:hypothetical protein